MGLSQFDENFPVIATSLVDDSFGAWAIEITDQNQRNLRIDSVLLATNETVDHVVKLYLAVNGQNFPIGTATLLAGAGGLGVPALEMITACLPASIPAIVLAPGTGLGFILDAPLATGNLIWALAFGGLI